MRHAHPTAADLMGGPVVGDEQVCFEVWGSRPSDERSAAEARRLCHYDWRSEAPCDRPGALGKCWDPAITHWWYPSSTVKSADDVKNVCEERGLEFSEP
jgi:hypothetical protein